MKLIISLQKLKLNSLEMYEIHDLVSRANQTIKSSIVSSLNLIIALYTHWRQLSYSWRR